MSLLNLTIAPTSPVSSGAGLARALAGAPLRRGLLAALLLTAVVAISVSPGLTFPGSAPVVPNVPGLAEDLAVANNLEVTKVLDVHSQAAPALTSTPAEMGAPLAANALPDFSSIRDTSQKKAAFYAYLLPIIHDANAAIAAERHWLFGVRESILAGETITLDAAQTLVELEQRYGLSSHGEKVAVRLGQLLRRVDVVPESLVLAQAAKESGWGVSRFAREGNNLFGIWCFTRGCGLLPQHRTAGLTHEVARFEDVAAGVRYYLRTINTHRAYHLVRNLRATARRDKVALHGELLAAGLERYSERGLDYVREIQSMIRYNGLHRFTVIHSA